MRLIIQNWSVYTQIERLLTLILLEDYEILLEGFIMMMFHLKKE